MSLRGSGWKLVAEMCLDCAKTHRILLVGTGVHWLLHGDKSKKFTVTSKVLNRCPQSVRNVQLSDQTLTYGSPERLPLARSNELHARTDDWNVGHACLGNILPVGTQQILQDDSWLEHFVPATSSRPTTALSCRHSPLNHVTSCLLMHSQLMNVA